MVPGWLATLARMSFPTRRLRLAARPPRSRGAVRLEALESREVPTAGPADPSPPRVMTVTVVTAPGAPAPDGPEHTGVERLVTSTVGIPTDLTVSSLDPLPEGPVRMRYRPWPFLALEDDRGVWFAGPVILLATAILGTMLKVLFRFSPLAWIMGT